MSKKNSKKILFTICAFMLLTSISALATPLDDLIGSLNNQSTNDKIIAVSHKPKVDSESALVINGSTGAVIYKKNTSRIASIASISKLMTAMVIIDAKLPMDEPITINQSDVDHLKNSRSRLQVGTTLPRHEMLLLALMSSENRAAHALARTYPGGIKSFIYHMNRKAKTLRMRNTNFYDPTGLTPKNTSTASDLALMVKAAYKYPNIRQYTTWHEHQITTANGRELTYKNSNKLIREGIWDISLQKTGYIKESGRCMVVRTMVASQPLIIILLDANNNSNRVNDARIIKTWLEHQPLFLLQQG